MGKAPIIMSNSGDNPMEGEEYEHGEELLLDGAKKLVIVSVAKLLRHKPEFHGGRLMFRLTASRRFFPCCIIPDREGRSYTGQCSTIFRQQEVFLSTRQFLQY